MCRLWSFVFVAGGSDVVVVVIVGDVVVVVVVVVVVAVAAAAVRLLWRWRWLWLWLWLLLIMVMLLLLLSSAVGFALAVAASAGLRVVLVTLVTLVTCHATITNILRLLYYLFVDGACMLFFLQSLAAGEHTYMNRVCLLRPCLKQSKPSAFTAYFGCHYDDYATLLSQRFWLCFVHFFIRTPSALSRHSFFVLPQTLSAYLHGSLHMSMPFCGLSPVMVWL